MSTGEVKRLYERAQKPIAVIGIDGRVQWNAVFEHNPKIARAARHAQPRILNGPNARPYIASKTSTRWTWRPYRPIRGELYFSPFETAEAQRFEGRVLIEPNVKKNGHTNKAWPWPRWQAVVDAFPAGTFVQCVPPLPIRRLERVELAVTLDFRAACAVLAVSRGFVGAEGGLHHGAAALDKPAVVLWSHFIAPEFTGYDSQTNLRHADDTCGSRVPCAECAASMDAISVDEVVANIKERLQ